MSSPLDNRMRVIAREEVTALLGVPGGAQAPGSAPASERMQQQITDLHEHLHHAATTIGRLEARVGALETAAGQADQEERPTVKRAPRKAGGTAATPE